MRKLDRYVGWNVLSAMIMVLVILVALESLFAMLGQFDDIRGNFQFADLVVYTLLLVPKKIYAFIPVSALIGCLAGLGSMATNSELVVMRSAGISLWRMVWSVMKPALVLVLFGVMLGEYVAPITEQVAETRKNIARSTHGEYSGEGVWHREGNEFMYFNAVEPNGVLYGVSRYVFDDNMRLKETSFAQRAIYQKNHWLLEDVITSRFDGEKMVSERVNTEPWETSLTTTLLKVVVVKPDGLSISGLKTYTDYLDQQGLDTGEYDLAFWTKVLQPLSVFSLVLVGISFIFGPLRSVNMGFRIFSGVITGVVFMIVQSLLGPSSLVFGFSPLFAVLIPVLVCIAIGSLFLWRAA